MSTSLGTRKGHGYFGTDPAIVEELKELAVRSGGLLKAHDVVEAARNEDSAIHRKFEWHDGEAAEKYRLIQARALISISVQFIPKGNKAIPTKVFVSLSTDRTNKGGAGYRTLASVMSDADMKNQLLMDSLDQMTHFQEKYKSLQELTGVFSVMEDTKKKIETKIGKKGNLIK